QALLQDIHDLRHLCSVGFSRSFPPPNGPGRRAGHDERRPIDRGWHGVREGEHYLLTRCVVRGRNVGPGGTPGADLAFVESPLTQDLPVAPVELLKSLLRVGRCAAQLEPTEGLAGSAEALETLVDQREAVAPRDQAFKRRVHDLEALIGHNTGTEWRSAHAGEESIVSFGLGNEHQSISHSWIFHVVTSCRPDTCPGPRTPRLKAVVAFDES